MAWSPLQLFHHGPARQAPDHDLPRHRLPRAGSDQILTALEKQLGVKEGETTKDGRFTLSTARCIGACALAPAMSVGDDVYGKLTADKIPQLFKTDLKKYV